MNTQPEGKKSLSANLGANQRGVYSASSLHPEPGIEVEFEVWTHGKAGPERCFRVVALQPEENGPVVVKVETFNGANNPMLAIARYEY